MPVEEPLHAALRSTSFLEYAFLRWVLAPAARATIASAVVPQAEIIVDGHRYLVDYELRGDKLAVAVERARCGECRSQRRPGKRRARAFLARGATRHLRRSADQPRSQGESVKQANAGKLEADIVALRGWRRKEPPQKAATTCRSEGVITQ